MVAIFSIRLDETGTDGMSPYTVLGGAVATVPQWDSLEQAWAKLLRTNRISAFHAREFNERHGEFSEWGTFKRKRFADAQKKIVNKNTVFRVSVGIESAVHQNIKKRMKGIKGFRPDSDYSLCLRYLMFLACEELEKLAPDFHVTIMLENGPWASGAVETYHRISQMTGKWKPAKHAHRLAGIDVLEKGESLTLEAADYLVDIAHRRMLDGKFQKADGAQSQILLTEPFLEQWYQGMLAEKEVRREYGRSRSKEQTDGGN